MTNTATASSNSATANSQWPWMNGTKCRVNSPLPKVNDHDKRPTVKGLIVEHRSQLHELRAALAEDPLFHPSKHDDLWLLRFLMSHKRNFAKALEAAKFTLKFRQEHRLDEFDIRHLKVNDFEAFDTKGTHPYAESFRKIMACWEDGALLSCVPDANRGIIHMSQLARRDQNRLAKELTEEEFFQGWVLGKEWIFQWLDNTTRKTGLLTKCLRLADANGAQLSKINKETKVRESKAAGKTEDVYPQLMSSLLVVNAPSWADMVFSLIKPFMPKRVLEKIGLIKPLKKPKDLERILEHCALENLPTRYGGTLKAWAPKNNTPILSI